jgi:hypothetical protein
MKFIVVHWFYSFLAIYGALHLPALMLAVASHGKSASPNGASSRHFLKYRIGAGVKERLQLPKRH